MNVVIISLDTLRADVGFSGRFPAIEHLRSHGFSFTTTVSSSPLTPISHATVFTGLQPPHHGVRHLLKEQLRPDATTIADVFAAEGYETGAIVSCPGMNAWYGLNRGFRHYDDWVPPLADGTNAVDVIDVELRGTALKRAPMVVERALDWVRSASGPVMLFAHFFDAHWPYEAPEAPSVPLPNAYEEEVGYMDRYLGELVEGLAGVGLDFENTLFVMFSDHGEDLAGWYPNDHAGELGHPEEKGHGCLLFDATQLVPFVVCVPGARSAGGQTDALVRLVDVAPTVFDLAGIVGPPMDGRSLVPLLHDEPLDPIPAYCEAFYREELSTLDPTWLGLLPWKATRTQSSKLVWEVGGDRVWSYELERDPTERSPIAICR